MLHANATMIKPARKKVTPTPVRRDKSSKNPRVVLTTIAMASVVRKAVLTIRQQPVPAPTPVMTVAGMLVTNAV